MSQLLFHLEEKNDTPDLCRTARIIVLDGRTDDIYRDFSLSWFLKNISFLIVNFLK